MCDFSLFTDTTRRGVLRRAWLEEANQKSQHHPSLTQSPTIREKILRWWVEKLLKFEKFKLILFLIKSLLGKFEIGCWLKEFVLKTTYRVYLPSIGESSILYYYKNSNLKKLNSTKKSLQKVSKGTKLYKEVQNWF